MFIYLLLGVLVAASVHFARSRERTVRRMGELTLLYLLVGYCGIPMLAVSGWVLLRPDEVAAAFGLRSGILAQNFLGYAYLGMSVIATLALRYRRAYLIAPAICWAVFFAGATAVHLHDHASRGALTHHGFVGIFATHALISLLLVAALLASGLLRDRG